MPTDPLSIESLCDGLDLPDGVIGFEHAAGGRVVFGPGTLAILGDEVAALGAKRVLIVTDPGIARTGAVARAVKSIAAAGLSVTVYDQVRENPTTEDVERCVAAARAAETDLIVGLGGGVEAPRRGARAGPRRTRKYRRAGPHAVGRRFCGDRD